MTMDPVWTGVFIGASALVIIVLSIIINRKHKKTASIAGKPVPLFSTIPELNEAIEFTGFAYDESQDIFYSLMNPWQRDFGYCRFYDEAMATLSMIIDAEPIYFDYDGRHWLIQFWKGQYGMTTGGEVGIYCTDSDDTELIDWNGRLYKCVSDDERLDIYQTLYKNSHPLFTRHEKHWWLTGFVLGEFSQPEELSMIIRLTFKDLEMRDAFLKGLREAGYSPQEYRVKRDMVAIYYGTPHTSQPLTRTKITDSLTQSRNREFCEIYQRITAPFNSITDKLNALRQENEELYNMAIHFGKQRELFQSLNKLKREREAANDNQQSSE
ncbi:MAG TPA: hypothetical protein DEB10_06650 [Ruminococcaceae bacterium]|nr:hypothetical protein [Oscillospiraceae bacterium]HCA28924.1 hypothetical protein [Oscillospiraceae bacterium]